MKRLRIAPWLLLAFAAASAAGCISLDKSYPEKRYFMIETRPEAPQQAPVAALLKVRPLRAAPGFDAPGLVYKVGEFSYEADFYNEFFVEPADMLTQRVVEWLSRRRVAETVVGGSSRLQPDYVLDGSIDALYGDYQVGDRPEAVLEIEFLLLRADNGSEVVFQKTYSRRTEVWGAFPDGLVRGWGAALEQILAELEADLRAAMSGNAD